MKIKLDPGAKMPTKAHSTDAGYDICSREKKCVYAHSSAVFDTGVHIQLPPGTEGHLRSKSGLNFKHDLISDGTIDEGYTGSIHVKLYNLGSKSYIVNKGDKISQLVIEKLADIGTFELVGELEDTDRGDGGFGSSGK